MRRADASLLLRTLELRGGGAIDPLEWTPAVLASILPVVRSEGAELWLYRRLEELGILSDEAVAHLIRPTARELAIRWMRVDEQTEAVIREFTALGIPFALIKGPARRAAAGTLYRYADAKSSSDVDVMVPEDRAEAAWHALIEREYEVAADAHRPRIHPHHFHLPPIWDDRRVAVEIHFSTDRWVPPREAWRRATVGADPVTWSGHDLRIPNATELVWHGLAHAFKQGPPLAYRLRSLLDAVAIMASGAVIRWDVIRERIDAGEVREQHWSDQSPVVPAAAVFAWLGAAAGLAGARIPEDMSAHGVVSLERLVRWRALLDGVRSARLSYRLLEEGIRCEAGLVPTPSAPGAPSLVRAQYFANTGTARLSYLIWRGLTSPT